MHKQAHGRRRLVSAAIAICATWFAGSVATAFEDVQLTTVRGDASIADTALTGRSELAEDQQLTTGDDGNLSVLLDRNAVVELCGHSQVRFSRDKAAGTRIVQIDAGEVKLIVEPRNAGERIEIHTPAAIATILGTVVYVSVDPVTGATTISSSQSQVNIRGIGDTTGTGITISAYEQLTVVPGQQHQKKKSVSHEQIAAMTSCLLNFHEIAVEMDRIPQQTRAVERVAFVDIGRAELPPVAAGRPPIILRREIFNSAPKGPDPKVILDPTITNSPMKFVSREAGSLMSAPKPGSNTLRAEQDR
ncbi:MAG: FecR domain-containing protein [Myxococcota bacterium]